jgi:nucleoside 2-deoxyribosyltransferase
MKIYLAAGFTRKYDVNQDANLLRRWEHGIVSTWHAEDSDYKPDSKDRAVRDAVQIQMADVIIVFIGGNEGCNRFWELGYAMGLGKRVVLIGDYDRCLFERLCHERYDCLEDVPWLT